MTQLNIIMKHLKAKNRITPLQAVNLFGCLRLASRIHEMIEVGVPVKSRFIKTKTGKRVKEYWL